MDFVGDAGYFLFLQRLGHVDEVCGMPFLAGVVEVAHRAQSHDVLPAMVLAEYFEHLLLVHHLGQLLGVLARRDAQEQSVVIFHHVEHLQSPRGREQRTVEIVHRVVQPVVVCVDGARALEQPHLALHSRLSEHLDGVLRGALYATEGDVGRHNLLHPPPDGRHVAFLQRPPDAQVAIVAARHGRVDADFAPREQVVHGLHQHEEKRTGVGAHTRRGSDVEKLHVLVIIETVVQAFHLVVHLGAHRPVGHLQI